MINVMGSLSLSPRPQARIATADARPQTQYQYGQQAEPFRSYPLFQEAVARNNSPANDNIRPHSSSSLLYLATLYSQDLDHSASISHRWKKGLSVYNSKTASNENQFINPHRRSNFLDLVS